MGLPANIHLRDATPADQVFLEDLFIASHRDEFAPLGLDETQLLGLLRMQVRGQRMTYAKDFPQAKDQIVLDEAGTPVGRFLVDTSGDGFHLLDIALLPSVRGAGIGTKLLEGLIAQSKNTHAPVRLSVQSSNRAFHLYKRLGFQVVSGGVQLQMEYRPDVDPGAEVISDAAKPEGALPGGEWEALVGKAFVIDLGTSERLPSLSLFRFQRSRHSASSFTLTFHGPMEPILSQGMYPLKLETANSNAEKQPELIFIVPIGPEAGAMQYEAIFNL
jgi:ribosomal protein S18 acetylase RimI-like enzyme